MAAPVAGGESVMTGTARARGHSVGRLVARFEAQGFHLGHGAAESRTAGTAHPLASAFARWWRACQPSAQLRRPTPGPLRPPRGRQGVQDTFTDSPSRAASAPGPGDTPTTGPATVGLELRRGPSHKPPPSAGEEHSAASPGETSLSSTGTPPSAGVEASSGSDSEASKAPQWLMAAARAFLAARGVPVRKARSGKSSEPSAANYRLDSDTEGSDAELSEQRRGAKDVLAAAKLLLREVRLTESWSAGSARQLPDFFAADVADELWARPPGAASRPTSLESVGDGPATVSCAEEPHPAPCTEEVLAELEVERRARVDCAGALREAEEQKEALRTEVLAELEVERRARLDCADALREAEEQKEALRAEAERLSRSADALRAELKVAQQRLPELDRERGELLRALREMQECEAMSPDAELQLALASTTAAVHELRQRLSNSEAAKRQLQQRCEKLEARDQALRPELQRSSQLQLLLQEEQQLRQNLEEEVAALRASRAGEQLPDAVLSAADLAQHLQQGPAPQGSINPSPLGAKPWTAWILVMFHMQLSKKTKEESSEGDPCVEESTELDLIPGQQGRPGDRVGFSTQLSRDWAQVRVGLAALSAGASGVVLTDRGAVASQLQREASENPALAVAELAWGKEPQGTFDVILAPVPATSSTIPKPDISLSSIPSAER
ncbi:unnamed protein product [Symbiodinium natans]|uniref:Uncharacterized protein n=1 Tax=Symbiodinium natans TaxID=878477 RepID=A0A812PFN6_9DINO|nr:unnamed protein product [Symbiodinium natans]